MTILMEALGYQNYGGKFYVRGETIPVESEGDAADMTAMRLAKRLPTPKSEPKPAPVLEETRTMVAETEDSAMVGSPAKDAEEKGTVPPPKRGQYLHRAARTSR